MPEESEPFGRYRLLRRIAVGGMAEVYLARLVVAEGVERLLVIKRVLPHLARNREFIERFIDEARIALPLTHAAITAVFDFGRVDDDYYIAMEYVHGTNLAEAIEQGHASARGFPIDVALYIVAQVASALDYAHRAADADGRVGVVHRDVSPQNVLLSYSGGVKLTDFGIAQVRSRMEFTSQMVRGKPNYLSPEQAQGKPVDARCDLFALGVVLYEMLTGVRAFEDESAHATMTRIVREAPSPPSKHRPELGPGIDRIVLKALQKRPEDRWASGTEMQAALTRELHERTPDFTSQHVAEWLSELFPEEVRQQSAPEGSAEPPDLRARLIGRLRDSDVDQDLERMSTGELLELNTVAVPVLAPEQVRAPAADARRRRLMAGIALGGVAALVLLAVTVLGNGDPPGNPGTSLAAGGSATAAPPERTALPPPLFPLPMTSLVAGPEPYFDPGTSAPVATAKPPGSDPKTAKAPKDPVTEYGIVTFTALPWAVVYVNGRKLGNTPVRRVKLAVGSHKVRFVNPSLELAYERVVGVTTEAPLTIGVDLEREGHSIPTPE